MLTIVVAQTGIEGLVSQYQGIAQNAGVFLGTVVGIYLAGRALILPPVARVVRARNPNNRTIAGAIELYLRVLFVVIAIPIGIGAAGLGGVAARSGIVLAAATLALGVAGQDVIGNLVSGVFLVADPDFNIGDYIEWDSKAGTIEEIDLRVTRLRTPGGEIVVVPNTMLTTAAIRRPFARDRYRLTERITVGYTENLDAVRRTMADVAAEDPRVLTDPAPEIHVTELGGSAVEVTAWFWVDDPMEVDIAAVRTEYRMRAKQRLLDAGVTVAPPTQQDLSGKLRIDSTGSDG